MTTQIGMKIVKKRYSYYTEIVPSYSVFFHARGQQHIICPLIHGKGSPPSTTVTIVTNIVKFCFCSQHSQQSAHAALQNEHGNVGTREMF